MVIKVGEPLRAFSARTYTRTVGPALGELHVKSFWIALGALLAGLAVAAGALGAHGLKTWVDQGRLDIQQLTNFETAVRYQMYHAFGLIIV